MAARRVKIQLIVVEMTNSAQAAPPRRVLRLCTDWGAGITAAVASYQASGLFLTQPSSRLSLALSLGLTLIFVMRRMSAARSLKATHAQLSLPLADALDSMTEGVLVVDIRGTILLANQSLRKTLDRSSESLQGTRIDSLDWEFEDESLRGNQVKYPWEIAIEKSGTESGTILGLKADNGKPQRFIVNATTVKSGLRTSSVALVTLSDVTVLESRKGELVAMLRDLKNSRDEISKRNDELQKLATHDPLTSCLNRRGFLDQFETLWSTAERTEFDIGFLMIDIDHFKSVNDTHGHSKGDEVLKGIAGLLKKTFRDTDVICRYGGEEFCVVLPEQNTEASIRAAKRFQAALHAGPVAGLRITASIGVSTRCMAKSHFEQMIDQADQCLYVAKRNGRDRIVSWASISSSPDANLASGEESELPEDCNVAPERLEIRRSDSVESNAVTDASLPDSDVISPQAVSALVSALEYRDPTTGEHSKRVAALCSMVGQKLMNDRELRLLETAALLHDIGKIGVPDSILLKPSQLSADEWEIMHRQERIGVEIVRSAFSSEPLAEIIRTHGAHYCDDSSTTGMPTGEDIPLGARIISVCNAFDAMTSDRVYRKGMSIEAAINELRSCAGNQFDPVIVDSLVETIRSQGGLEAIPCLSRLQVSFRIGQQIERIAESLDLFDFKGICAISDRLVDTATAIGEDQIAAAAQRLSEAISADEQLEDLVQLTQTLMSVWQESGDESADEQLRTGLAP